MYQNTNNLFNQNIIHNKSNHSIILSDIALYGYSNAKEYKPTKVSIDEDGNPPPLSDVNYSKRGTIILA